MEIVREKPCQRLHHRVTAPLKVTMKNGESLFATNWSLGGLRLDNLPQTLPPVGSVLELKLELPFQGFDIAFDVKARVVRTATETGTIGAQFVELSERANDLMGHFIEDLIRGKMATIEDTICRIDVPVTPISTKPDANPAEDVPVRRWPIKTILMSTFYIIFGVCVFAYLGFLIFSYTTRMEVTSAVVTAPLVHVAMPMDGQIIPLALETGVEVKRGQKLARVIDPRIDAKISDLKIQSEKNRRDLARAQERLRIEEDRMKLYQVVNQTSHDVAKARVGAAQEALFAIDIRHERLVALRKKGLIEQAKVEGILRERAGAEARLKKAQYELERAVAMQSVSMRRHFNDKEFVSDLDLLALDVEEAHSKLALTNMKLGQLERTKAGLVVKAPFDGRIISVSASENITLLRGKNIATIEKLTEPQITAFLNQEEIVHVGMNDEASVYLPALDKRFKARVQKIDRSSLSLRMNASDYVWSDDKEKSAFVALRFQLPEEEQYLVRGGLPAVVIFSRRSVSGFYKGIKQVFTGAGSEVSEL